MWKLIYVLLIVDCLNLISGYSIVQKTELLQSEAVNFEPVIGVLSQEISYSLNQKYPDQYHSYIAASYVKFVESAGARVVPVWIDRPREYYEEMMKKLNGVLFPGGATYFNQSNGYSEAGRHIYDIAMEMNEKNDYMPLWGTCLGFELLTYLSANGEEHRTHCSSSSQSLPLEFKKDFRNSRLFGSAPEDVIEILSTEDVTSNFHQFCVTEKNLTDFNLERFWTVMSINKDWNGLEFISTIEHKSYPFYGIQFHPEKNLFEWVLNKNISHTPNAVTASQYFANFFVNETRKSKHHFKSAKDVDNFVIYNFPATFTGSKGSGFEQSYMFEEGTDYTSSSRNVISQVLDDEIVNH